MTKQPARPPAPRAEPPPEKLRAVVALFQQGRLREAEASAKALTQSHPLHPFGWKALAGVLREQGRIRDAVQPMQNAARLLGDADSFNNLGLMLQEAGDAPQAEENLVRALQLNPKMVEAHCNLGRLYLLTGRLAQAESSLRHALAIRPYLVEAHNNLAAVLRRSGRLLAAEASCRRAIELRPQFYEAYTSLGAILNSMGRLSEAEVCLRRALELRPQYLEAHSSLLGNHTYSAHRSPHEDLEEACRYGRLVAARAEVRYTTWRADAGAERLRVGLVSADLREHPVGYFLEGLLAQIDRSRIELFGYPISSHGDALTSRLQPHFAKWTLLYGRSDAEAAQLIHADGIHVLIDLSGHSAQNRLPVFASKPAPVQVTWLGYVATTGVAEIDYLLADAVSVPPEHQDHFSEAIWYLPQTRLCFTPPADAPAVAPLPALTNGFVTFGNFQNLAKFDDAQLALWGKVFAAIPDARLRAQNKELADPEIREQLGRRLQRAGISAERVSLHGPQPRRDYLAVHAEVDLLLDTHPFPGGTTTCEALIMGVPTLTLAGDRLISRQGASILTAAGLTDWIAASAGDFVAKALAFSRDARALAALRASLRDQVLQSALCDVKHFALNFEDALWQMWSRRRG